MTASPALLQTRRLVEVVTDFAAILISFSVAYLLLVDGLGTGYQRQVFVAAVILLGTRYVAFVGFGVYRRIWRCAGARDLASIAAATFVSAPVRSGCSPRQGPEGVSVGDLRVDALLCSPVVGAARPASALAVSSGPDGPARVLVVGAGRRAELCSRAAGDAGERVIGFVDDNPAAAAADPGRGVIGGLDNGPDHSSLVRRRRS